LTAGYPEKDEFADNLSAIGRVAEVVEIGVPFTDPMADGVTIQRASHHAIQSGVTLEWILDELAGLQVEAPLVLMSYLNPLLSYGLEKLARTAAERGVAGVIVPDLPFEEGSEVRDTLDTHDIGLVQLVTPVTPEKRLAELCRASRGFVYAVTITGTTGGGKQIPDEVSAYLDKVRESSPLPVCAGFGIRSPEQVASLSAHADGVIVGSALVEALEAGADPVAFLNSLRAG
jgi:tryptophan synthase alpha chain